MLDALTGFVVVGAAILVGYIIGRTGVLGQHARHVLSRLIFFVLSPALLFVVLSHADVAVLFSALLPVSVITALAMIIVFVVLSRLFFRRSAGETVIGALSAGQVNANNIGIPISAYLLGSAAYSAPVVLFQLLILMPVALGILEASRFGGGSIGRVILQTVRNPMLIGAALGVLVSVTGVEVPPIVMDPIETIGAACVPIMLISYGISLHGQRPLTGSTRLVDVLVASGLQLILMPVTAWGVGLAFGLPAEQLLIVVVLAALPTAQNVFNFSQRYDIGESISRDTILITTIGCVPVLFLVTLLLG